MNSSRRKFVKKAISLLLAVAMVVMAMPQQVLFVKADTTDIALTVNTDGTVSGVPAGNALAKTFPYTGAQIKPTVSVTGQTVGTDYTVTYGTNKDVSTGGKVTISSKKSEGDTGYFADDVVITFSITAREITAADLNITDGKISDREYTGAENKPTVEELQKEGGATFDLAFPDTDYTNIGTKNVTVTGTGNYTGTLALTYNVTKARLKEEFFKAIADVQYDGAEHKLVPSVVDGLDVTFTTMHSDADYKNAGAKHVTVVGSGNYRDDSSVALTYSITPITLTASMVSISPSETLWTKGITNPSITVKSGSLDIKDQCTISYPSSYDTYGTYYITVTPKGTNVTGSAVKVAYNLIANTSITEASVKQDNFEKVNGVSYYNSASTDRPAKIQGTEGNVIVSATEGTLTTDGVLTLSGDVDDLKVTVEHTEGGVTTKNEVSLGSFKDDTTAPEFTVTLDSQGKEKTADSKLWTTSQKYTVNASDTGIGLGNLFYKKKGEDAVVSKDISGGSVELTLEEETTYEIWVEDLLGNGNKEASHQTVSVGRMDTTAPTIVITNEKNEVIEEGAVLYLKEDTTFNVTVNDTVDGVAGIGVDGEESDTIPYIHENSTESKLVEYTAKDLLGNESTVHFTVVFDSNDPRIDEVKLNGESKKTIVTNKDVTITAKITDDMIAEQKWDVDNKKLITTANVDQLALVELRAISDDGEEYEVVSASVDGNTYTWSIKVKDSGYLKQAYQIVAEDKSGGAKVVDGLSVEIDKDKPTIKDVAIDQEVNADGWVNNPVQFTVAIENKHGDNNTIQLMYQREEDGETWTTMSNGTSNETTITFQVPGADGSFKTTYYFKAIDQAGNESAVKEYKLNQDVNPPSVNNIFVTYTVEGKNQAEKAGFLDTIKNIFAKQKIGVTLYIQDDLSGTKTLTCSYNGKTYTGKLQQGVHTEFTVDGKVESFDSFTFTVPGDNEDQVKDSLKIESIGDFAGNILSGADAAQLPTGTAVMIVDDMKPVLRVNYPNGDIPTGSPAYYSAAKEETEKVVELVFTEKFFKEAGTYPEITLKKNNAAWQSSQNGQNTNNITWGSFDDKGSSITASIALPYDTDKKEGVTYTISTSYQDGAGNLLEYNINDSFATFNKEKGIYTSGEFKLYYQAPQLELSLVDKNNSPVATSSAASTKKDRYYFAQPIKVKVEVKEGYCDAEMLQEAISTQSQAYEYSYNETGKKYENKAVAVMSVQEIRDLVVEGAETDVWYIPLEKVANYDISFVGSSDYAGNKATFTDLNGQNAKSEKTIKVCYDNQAPELTAIESMVKTINSDSKNKLYKAVEYNGKKYLFAHTPLKIGTEATDKTAGLGKELSVARTGSATQGDYSLSNDSPVPYRQFYDPNLLVPADSAVDYNGSVTVKAVDLAGNETSDGADVIIESQATHKSKDHIVITLDTASPRGNNYYRSDVSGIVKFTDEEAGIENRTVKPGTNNTVGGKLSDSELFTFSGALKTKDEIKFTVKASDNNKNNVEIIAKLTDNAGNESEKKKTINIDKDKPVITVDYDLNNPSHETYYNATRTATVTIKERSFDANDVKFTITNTDGAMPSISGWSNSGDNHVCYVTFSEDGDYTFTLSFQDLAGNVADYNRVDSFTIDKTIPQYTVTYDNNNSQNGTYFNASRTATIEVHEHNFDASLVNVNITTGRGGSAAPGGWSTNGDTSVCRVNFSTDGDYILNITGTDLAGNEFAPYTADRFVIDTVAPSLEIFDIEDKSANNGVVMPGVRYSDINYDADITEIKMSGYHNGVIDMSSNGTVTRTAVGVEIKLNDFEHIKSKDDLYTMSAVVYDRAGNSAEASVTFSVNRFGSVYTFDDKTEELLGDTGKYYTNAEREIVVVETNVDTLEFKEITCNANGELTTMKEGEDFTVGESGSDESWKQYTYTLAKDNFTQEGDYLLTIYSEDRAKNVSDNNTKGKKLEFVIDKTAPSIVIGGVVNDGHYRASSRLVTLDVQDNVLVSKVTVMLNGEEKVFSASEISDVNGRISIPVGSSNSWQTISVAALDAAGNMKMADPIRFLVSANLIVQLLTNRITLVGIIVALIGLGGGFFIIGKKRRKDEEQA